MWRRMTLGWRTDCCWMRCNETLLSQLYCRPWRPALETQFDQIKELEEEIKRKSRVIRQVLCPKQCLRSILLTTLANPYRHHRWRVPKLALCESPQRHPQMIRLPYFASSSEDATTFTRNAGRTSKAGALT